LRIGTADAQRRRCQSLTHEIIIAVLLQSTSSAVAAAADDAAVVESRQAP